MSHPHPESESAVQVQTREKNSVNFNAHGTAGVYAIEFKSALYTKIQWDYSKVKYLWSVTIHVDAVRQDSAWLIHAGFGGWM